ncbi:MAG: hypothetical protein ACJAVK_001226 [Akkermansiaceae bacterium]|jgi:hypothetical protein
MLYTPLELAEAGTETVFIDQSIKVPEAGLPIILGTFRYYLPILDNRASTLSFQVVYPRGHETAESQI